MSSNVSKAVKATIFDVYQSGSKKLAEAVMDLNNVDTLNAKEVAIYVTQLSALLKDFSDKTDAFISSLDILVSYMTKNKVNSVKKNNTNEIKARPVTKDALPPTQKVAGGSVAPQVKEKALVSTAAQSPKAVDIPEKNLTKKEEAPADKVTDSKKDETVTDKKSDLTKPKIEPVKEVATSPALGAQDSKKEVATKEDIEAKDKETEIREKPKVNDSEKQEFKPAVVEENKGEEKKDASPVTADIPKDEGNQEASDDSHQLIPISEDTEEKKDDDSKHSELIPLIIPLDEKKESEKKKDSSTIGEDTLNNNLEHEKYLKDNTNKTKAILVNQKQLKKLELSRADQKKLIDFGMYNESDSDDIEALLAEAGTLYHEGKTKEAQALYDKVSQMNKSKENVLVKKAA